MNSANFTRKRNYCILIILSLLFTALFSLDTENYTYSGLALDYNYYGVPFYIDVGYQIRDNHSNLFIPFAGVGIESGSESLNLFTNAKIEYRYKRFFTQVGFKQGLIPYIGTTYAYENLEKYGQFMLGYFFNPVAILYNVDAGNMYIRDSTIHTLSVAFQVNHSIEVSGLLYISGASTLSFETSVGLDTIIDHEQYSYDVYAKLPYSLYHYWGEFGIMPSLRYFQYFKNSKKKYAIGTHYLSSIGMMTIENAPESPETLYNFISSMHIEYKFYLRFLPNAFKSTYLVTYGNIGYGKELGKTFNAGSLLYTTGAGMGYALFGIAPLQITFGIDQSQNIIINLAVSTILH